MVPKVLLFHTELLINRFSLTTRLVHIFTHNTPAYCCLSTFAVQRRVQSEPEEAQPSMVRRQGLHQRRVREQRREVRRVEARRWRN